MQYFRTGSLTVKYHSNQIKEEKIMFIGNIIMIVLTGGPCGGKSTALSRLMEWLLGLGYCVAVVPEAATELKSSGIRPEKFSDPSLFQRIILRNIIQKEDLFSRALLWMENKNPDLPRILLCDRGLKDGQAYMDKENFQIVLNQENLDMAKICESRYAAVIHLRTAADGAEEFYTVSNNAAREESPEEARMLDKATENAWHGHIRHTFIDNSTDFEGKIMRVQQTIASLLGIPSPTEHELKFALHTHTSSIILPVHSSTFEIEQHYLDQEGERVRKMTRDGSDTFFHTFKENHPRAERVKVERLIDEERFLELLQRKDPMAGTIRKTRTYFVWENQYFELDHFHHNGMWMLEARSTQEHPEIDLPSFLPDAVDVTDNPNYYNFNIALHLSD